MRPHADEPGENGFEIRWVSTGEGRLYTRIGGPEGTRRPLVLIHAFVLASDAMMPLARALSRRHRVCTLDLPGYGLSDKPGQPLALDVLVHSLEAWMEAREGPMKIKDVMTPSPSYCVPEHSSVLAARIMKDKNVGIVPVVETEARWKLIGVVTDRDLCLAVVASGRHPDSVKVREVMTDQIITCSPDEDVRSAADRMRENQIRRVPVVDEQGMLQGMVSTADILQRSNLPSEMTHDTMRKVSEPTDHASKPRAQKQNRAA
ncbi:MAG TPA: alpha/beta fold hydrolase [Nitrospira sp.]|nr:alpha/beta fold hydrolase [Nitrospira sp.]